MKPGWSPVLATVAQAAGRAGADAVTVTSSIGPGSDLDIATGRPRLGIAGGFGGMSGRAIFPIALECVSRVAAAVSIPVTGCGGMSTAEDCLKMMKVGAACVQLDGAPLLRGAQVFDRITQRLPALLDRHGYRSLGDARGASSAFLRSPSQAGKRVPVVDASRCQPCGACARVCPAGAIIVDGVAQVDEVSCTGYGICVDVCPLFFDALTLADLTPAGDGDP